MHKVTGRDQVFYQDQLTSRECRLSEEVDDVFELNQEILRIQALEQSQIDMLEEQSVCLVLLREIHKMI